MLTITREGGNLVARFPGRTGGDWLPESDTTFFSEDLPIRITFNQNIQGEVIGLRWKSDDEERTIPRIGPLITTLKKAPDSNAALTTQIELIFKALAKGGQAIEESAGLTSAARKDFASAGPAFADWWAKLGMNSLAFIATQEVTGRQITRHGSDVNRMIYYKLLTGTAPHYALIYLTADDHVADIDIVED